MLPEFLDGIDLNTSLPENQMKSYREAIRQIDTQYAILQGNIESIEDAQKTAEQKLMKLYMEQADIEAKRKALADKQFDGIEAEDLAIQKDMLLAKLSSKPGIENAEVAALRAKIAEARQKNYVSKYMQAQAENAAAIKSLSDQYNALTERIKELRPGTQCPTCLMLVTEQNLPEVRNGMVSELKAMAARGHELMAQGHELTELDHKAKAVFEQFKAEDIQKLSADLEKLESTKGDNSDRTQLLAALEHIDELQKYGNLSEEEFDLNCNTVTGTARWQSAARIHDNDVTHFNARGVYALLYSREAVTVDAGTENALRWLPQRVSKAFREKIAATWDDPRVSGFLTAELTGIQAQIQTVQELTDDKKLKDAYTQQEIYKEQIQKYKNILSALSEFVCKRTELAVADLQMPNVKIKLFDVVRTTGEVVNAFKFTYKGRDYTTLSLSEKTLAGIEITAMIRKITGIDCPVCVDNTESIAAFNSVSMPSQTLLLRFVKGQPLTVQFQNNVTMLRPAEQQLKKAS